MRKIHRIKNLSLLAVIFWGVSACQTPAQELPQFSPKFQHFIEVLSSDDFEGRAPNTPGGKRTKAFVEAEFRRIGLKPANRGSFRQQVPLLKITAYDINPLTIHNQDTSLSFDYISDMVIGTPQRKDSVQITGSELVFAGYGIVAPEFGWNDYENIDVEGKTVVVLINDPGFELKDPDLFTGRAMTYYGRWTYKYEEAARQGAKAVLIVHETEPASYGWDVVKNSWSGTQFHVGGNTQEPKLLAEGWIQKNVAEEIFSQAGFSFEELKQQALSPEFTAVNLNLSVEINFKAKHKESESENIIGYVEGSLYPEETVVYMAHWDHLGKTEGPDGPVIYNGAIDNATGTAAIMAIAEKFAKAETPPLRSVVFMAATAEESGLIGSRYYALHPLFKNELKAGGINIDGLNVYGPTHDVSVIGYSSSSFQNILELHASEQNRVLIPDAYPENGYFFRSDHFSLVREGVPMIYANSGMDFIGKNPAFADRVREDKNNRYHSTDDVIHGMWNWKGLDQNLWLLYHTGKDLANSDYWPQWNEENEFSAIRLESEDNRIRVEED